MQKLSRKQIKETLDSVPLDTVLLGAQSKDRTLTPRQKEFARRVALGETSKAQAYRDTYKSKGTPKTVGNQAYMMSKRPDIQAEVLAYQAANEASKYRTPAALREYIIHQLVLHSMNEDINPAQRIKSLELLGKVSEVAAFTERRETTVINQSSDIKQRLLSMLSNNAIDLVPHEANQVKHSLGDDADSLLEELKGEASDKREDGTPTHTPPPDIAHSVASETTHTIPHTQSTLESVPCSTSTQGAEPQVLDNIEDSSRTITSYSLESNIEDGVIDEKVMKEGVGAVENVEIGVDVEFEKVPHSGFRMK